MSYDVRYALLVFRPRLGVLSLRLLLLRGHIVHDGTSPCVDGLPVFEGRLLSNVTQDLVLALNNNGLLQFPQLPLQGFFTLRLSNSLFSQ